MWKSDLWKIIFVIVFKVYMDKGIIVMMNIGISCVLLW